MASSKGLTVKVEVGGDFDRLKAQFASLSDSKVNLSAARALNKVGAAARKEATPVIVDALNNALPPAVVRRAITFNRARPTQLYVDLRAIGSKRVRASLFKPRKTKTGVTIKIGSKSTRIPGAFVTRAGSVRVRGPNWKGQFFDKLSLRTKRIDRKKGAPDYPIPQVYVPGVPKAFLEKQVIAIVQSVAQTRFPIEFERDLRARSRGFVKGGANG